MCIRDSEGIDPSTGIKRIIIAEGFHFFAFFHQFFREVAADKAVDVYKRQGHVGVFGDLFLKLGHLAATRGHPLADNGFVYILLFVCLLYTSRCV